MQKNKQPIVENISENNRKLLAFGIGQDLHAAEARALGDAEAMKTHAAKHPDNTDRSRLNADRSRSGSRDETQIATSGTTGTGSGTGGSVSGVSGVSEALKSSHWTRQCEGYGSQASRSTEDIEKEHSVDSALDEESLEALEVRFELLEGVEGTGRKRQLKTLLQDLAEELMSVTFAKPFQKTRTGHRKSYKHSSELWHLMKLSISQYTVIQSVGSSIFSQFQFTFLGCAGSTAPARFETQFWSSAAQICRSSAFRLREARCRAVQESTDGPGQWTAQLRQFFFSGDDPKLVTLCHQVTKVCCH